MSTVFMYQCFFLVPVLFMRNQDAQHATCRPENFSRASRHRMNVACGLFDVRECCMGPLSEFNRLRRKHSTKALSTSNERRTAQAWNSHAITVHDRRSRHIIRRVPSFCSRPHRPPTEACDWRSRQMSFTCRQNVARANAKYNFAGAAPIVCAFIVLSWRRRWWCGSWRRQSNRNNSSSNVDILSSADLTDGITSPLVHRITGLSNGSGLHAFRQTTSRRRHMNFPDHTT